MYTAVTFDPPPVKVALASPPDKTRLASRAFDNDHSNSSCFHISDSRNPSHITYVRPEIGLSSLYEREREDREAHSHIHPFASAPTLLPLEATRRRRLWLVSIECCPMRPGTQCRYPAGRIRVPLRLGCQHQRRLRARWALPHPILSFPTTDRA